MKQASLLGTVVTTLLVSGLGLRQQVSGDFGLELNGVVARGSELVMDLGILGTTSTDDIRPGPNADCRSPRSFTANRSELRLNVFVIASRSLTLLITGSKISAEWLTPFPEASSLPEVARRRELAVRFKFGDARTQELNAIYFVAGDGAVAEVLVDYALMPSRVIQPVTSGLVPSSTANVTNWRDFHYQLMTGPPPPHYELVKVCSWLSGDRSCGSYSECSMNVTPRNVNMSFALQGHSDSEPHIRQSEGHIAAAYRLQESRPTVKTSKVAR